MQTLGLWTHDQYNPIKKKERKKVGISISNKLNTEG
jgi:hypothetical protein